MFLLLVCGVATASGAGEADLTVAEEKALLQNVFSPQLETIDADPARVLSDIAIERIDSPTEALVTLEGHTVLLESEIPLRAPEEDGDLSKVDLALEEDAAGGYAPANPLVDLALPESADEPIAIGEDGLTLSLQGAAETTASPLGEEDLFLPEAREDTSLLLSPISGGLELSAMLLSPDSPQQLTFAVNLPDGQKLRSDEEGGAEVVGAADEVEARVSAPRAFDAEGEEVPVELSVEGDSLVLAVPHREQDVAYPLFVDPEIIEENWSSFSDTSKLNYWFWQYGGVGAEDYIGWRSCITTCWGNGLYLRARSNFAYPAGSYGRWGFVPQGTTTYMRRVIFGPIHMYASNCYGNEPHGYVGIWNTGGFWSVLTNAYPTGYVTWLDTGEQNLGAGARTAYVAMHASSAANIKCGRDYQLGGATLFLEDPEDATVGAPTGYPSGWVKDGTSFTVNVPVSDPGLGVKSATIAPFEAPPLSSKSLTCTAHYHDQCPASHTFQFNVSADSFDQGEKEVRASAEDAIKRGSNTSSWMMKVDRTPPEITLDGQLAEATDETGTDAQDPEKWDALKLPVYNLKIDATDGSNASAAAKRSGVKGIAVYLDDRKSPEQVWWAPSCPESSCPLSKTFTLKLNELSADTHHTLRIFAQDFAENAPRERTIEFEYIPATGIKESDVMQYFPLPDGQGNEDEEEHPSRPELAVNVVNGNLVYRQTDAEVQGVGADLGLDLYYNSLLPESQNSEWGDGWTLSQTPDLELEEPEGAGPVTEATIVEESGGVESKVDLPATVGEEEFDKRLQATITKEAGGDFGLTDESGETDETLVFDESGRVEEARTGSAATVDYDYEGGDLAELSIEDPGTAMVAPGSLEEDEGPPRPALAYSAAVGTSGSGDGQLKTPADVVVDPQENLWVLDRGNARIEKFSPTGQFLAKFGSAGTGDGQLNNPSALAMDAAGNLLVAENYRVQKFSPSGQSLAKFGSFGSGAGQFLFPNGVAVGADGSIWVSDAGRVQRFNSSGQFIEQVGASGAGQVSSPQSLSADKQGNVFVADTSDDKIKVFDKEGDFVRSFGSSGTGDGQFSSPTEVEADADGWVWVGDDEADRVQLFTAAGEYVAQFGAPGSGEGQLKLEQWAGISSDGKGRLWIADTGNDRAQRWLAKSITGFFPGSDVGTSGAGDGQLKSPADALLDPQGNLWVLDRGNARVQEFGPDGQFLAKFGSAGTGDGQLNNPSALAMDAAGNLLVAENNRIQKFSPSGQALAKFGSFGSGAGQFLFPNGVAVGADGSIWVSDAGRVQRFNSSGQFIEQVGASGPGQLYNPQAVSTDKDGNVFVVDSQEDRVTVYDKEGDYLRQFGSSGSGPGQFIHPTEVEADAEGYVWVGDDDLDRVELFTSAGDYITQFDSPGSGEQQFQFEAWTGIASDGTGRAWIADAGHDRVASVLGGYYESSNQPALTEDDPKLEVEVSEGLVESVEGDEAGTIGYAHSGDLLTAVSKPEGEVEFAYDEAGRMTKVTLPNGTYGEIAYADTYGRVKSVKVSIEGAAPKTTYFEYSDEPRRTTVTPPDAPATTYEIGPNGSILRWANAKKPPTLDDLAGTLYDENNRETKEPISVGAHNLVIQAHSDEGIASIQVIANSNALVDEKTCEQDPEKEGIECVTQEDEWVTETGNWAPGILYLEVIATDRLGESTSERFWVNIPYTPPPDPEAEEPPRFNDIARFREEFGLDLDLKGDEIAINDRIFQLMGDWNNPNTPAGEVARATNERWGVPLRAVDAAELELRDDYLSHDSVAVEQWAEEHFPGTYAGFYIDHRAGGIVHIGFTKDQEARVSEIKEQVGLIAPVPRVEAYSEVPTVSRASLETTSDLISEALETDQTLRGQVSMVETDEVTETVAVETNNVSQTAARLAEVAGVNAPISVNYESGGIIRTSGRFRAVGRIKAGDRLWTEPTQGKVARCTSGYGAWEDRAEKSSGELVRARFLLTAGHCGYLGSLTARSSTPEFNAANLSEVGPVNRNAWQGGGWRTDSLAVRVAGGLAPNEIYRKGLSDLPVGTPTRARRGNVVCFSGITTDHKECGPVLGVPEVVESGFREFAYLVKMKCEHGDSGAPVWNPRTGAAIGLVVAFAGGRQDLTLVAPLLPIRGKSPLRAPGSLKALSLPDPDKPNLNLIVGQ